MTNSNLLKEKIEESGYKLTFIAKKLDISYQGFLNKMNNETEFKATEIKILCDLLNIETEEMYKIFFGYEVE
jgi:hypothetical protein